MLDVSKVNFELKFETRTVLPRWMGSTFRGGFGIHLRRASCIEGRSDCKTCSAHDDCLFYHLYERENAKKGHAPPVRPIIIVPPFFGKRMDLEAGSKLNLDMLFFGAFSRYLPHVLVAMKLFGETGIGSLRRYGLNTFTVEGANCGFSGREIYDGNTLNISNLKTTDMIDVPRFKRKSVQVGFKTPIILKTVVFPPSPEQLLALIRSRLLLYVNEYGTSERVPHYNCSGVVIEVAKHFQRLERRSRRGGAQEFAGFTGIADYVFDELDDASDWLISVGSITGGGPKSAFGCGFLDVQL